jgi:hypothetical protein
MLRALERLTQKQSIVKFINSITLIKVEFIESGEKINRRTAVLILLSMSFGVGYLFLPLSYFVKETWICNKHVINYY